MASGWDHLCACGYHPFLRRACCRGRTGFTLVELMVVIAVIGAMAALTVGVIFGLKGTAKAKATESLIADFVRQARQTALATNAPVALRIEQDSRTKVWRIQGVSQIPIFSESFEEDTTDAAGGVHRKGVLPGFTGFCWTMGISNGEGGTYADGSNGLLEPYPLSTNQALMRTKGDGFFISCQVRPVLVTEGGVSVGGQPAGGRTVVPLVTVGTSDDPDAGAAFAGIMLERIDRDIQNEQGHSPVLHCWAPYAWVGDHTLSGVVESDQQLLHVSTGNKDVLTPIGGDRWIQIAMVYDGQRLVLYQQGVQVAVEPNAGAIDPPVGTMQVFLGRAGGNAGGGMLDEVRIYRLGVDRPTALPGGVTPRGRGYRIVADAGTVTVQDLNGLAIQEMLFDTVDPETPLVWVRVTLNGQVTSGLRMP